MSVAERLREERERLGLSQSVLGDIGGVKKRAQINYESGERSPDAVYLRGVAQVGVDVQYVLLGVRSANLMDVFVSDEFVRETLAERAAVAPAPGGVSIEAVTADERELLALFRAAPLAVKAAAIGALQGGSSPSRGQKQINVGTNHGQVVEGGLVNHGPQHFGNVIKKK